MAEYVTYISVLLLKVIRTSIIARFDVYRRVIALVAALPVDRVRVGIHDDLQAYLVAVPL